MGTFGDLDINSLGINKDSVQHPENIYEAYLLEVGNEVASVFKNYIESNGISATGGLGSSVVAIPIGGLHVQIQADDYYKFINEGVNGTQIDQSAPYSFKHEKPSFEHVRQIEDWIPARGVFLPHGIPSYNSFAWAIATAVKKKGIAPRYITEGAMTPEVLQRIEQTLQEVTGLIISFTFDPMFEKLKKR